MTRLKDRVALVTGAASGIGRACARTLAAEGAQVVATDVNEAGGQAVVAEIVAAGGRARFVTHDVTSEPAWQSVVEGIKANEGKLQVLVNNAGIAWAGSILDMSLADWRRQQSINLEGVFLGIKWSVPLMRAGGGGSIVNISSVAGLKGAASLAGYCATKGGVRLLTKAVALESGFGGWNIRVNSVHPGVIDTPIWDSIVPSTLQAGANALDANEIAARNMPGRKAGLPEDIANGVLFLASDESSYMNGSELVIDAGQTA
jgi:NAD(P)-dependent dehydrogenase (short-subunit alcohol dehydrogenase family)